MAEPAAEAHTEAAQMAAALSTEAHRTERLRVILAALIFPLLAAITAWLVSIDVPINEWLAVVVAPVLTVVVGFVLSGRIATVAQASSTAVAANARVIDANRLHAAASIARVELHSQPRTEEGPPSVSDGGPGRSAEGGPVVG